MKLEDVPDRCPDPPNQYYDGDDNGEMEVGGKMSKKTTTETLGKLFNEDLAFFSTETKTMTGVYIVSKTELKERLKGVRKPFLMATICKKLNNETGRCNKYKYCRECIIDFWANTNSKELKLGTHNPMLSEGGK